MEGNLIKTLRQERNLTRKEFGLLIDVHESSVYRWEHDQGNPKPMHIKRISEVFNKPISELEKLLPPVCSTPNCKRYSYQAGLCQNHFNRSLKQEKQERRIRDMKIQTIGERIRYLRKEHQQSVQDFASEMGVTSDTITAWEENRITPKIAMIVEISSYFQVDSRFVERGRLYGGEIPFHGS
jgi:transcriptional regulator with XRE-family HTH domain